MNSPLNDSFTTDAAALKIRTLSVIVLNLYSSDFMEVSRQFEEKMSAGASFFQDSPLLLDLTDLAEDTSLGWIKRVNELAVRQGFIPVGITGESEAIRKEAMAAGIVCWPLQKVVLPGKVQEPQSTPAVEPVKQTTNPQQDKEPTYIPTKIIEQPVRSGQRVYAKGGDVIVTSSVNPGGEVMADGNIHIYGSLKGRALAGVGGREDVKIFCQDLQADLVAIAGYYTIHEDLPTNCRGKAVKITLDGERLEIDPFHP